MLSVFPLVWSEGAGEGEGGNVLLVYLNFGEFTLASGMSGSLEPGALFLTVTRIRWERIIPSA